MKTILLLLVFITSGFSQNYEETFLAELKKSYYTETINDALLNEALEQFSHKNYQEAYKSLIMAFRSTMEDEDISYKRNDFLLFMALIEQKLNENLNMTLTLAILEDSSINNERLAQQIKKLNFKL